MKMLASSLISPWSPSLTWRRMCASPSPASRRARSSHTRRAYAASSTRSIPDGCARLADDYCGTLESGMRGRVTSSCLVRREEADHVCKGDAHPVPYGNESGGEQCRSGFGADFKAAAGLQRPSGADGPQRGRGHYRLLVGGGSRRGGERGRSLVHWADEHDVE